MIVNEYYKLIHLEMKPEAFVIVVGIIKFLTNN